MKNQLVSAALCVLVLACMTHCSRPATSKAQTAGPTQTYAILPLDVTIEKNLQVKKTPPDMLCAQEERESGQYQSGVFQHLMERKKDFSVSFQDIDDTNNLLKRHNISYEKGRSMTKVELCRLLEVDGILTGRFQRKENLD